MMFYFNSLFKIRSLQVYHKPFKHALREFRCLNGLPWVLDEMLVSINNINIMSKNLTISIVNSNVSVPANKLIKISER